MTLYPDPEFPALWSWSCRAGCGKTGHGHPAKFLAWWDRRDHERTFHPTFSPRGVRA